MVLALAVGLGLTGAMISAVFALLPDIDTDKSRIGSLLRMHRLFVAHRTVTHSLLALGMSFGIGLVFGCTVPAIIGHGMHLLLDMLTPTGITLLYPFERRYVLLSGFIATGSRTEKIFTGVVLCLLAVLMFWPSLRLVAILLSLGSMA